MREDDWYDLGGRSVVYQERYVLFRNLFSVHTRSREVAPLVHDLMGRVGGYNDSAESITSTHVVQQVGEALGNAFALAFDGFFLGLGIER